MFKNRFALDSETRILDLGSENGVNIHSILQGTDVLPQNVYIADINEAVVEEGKQRFGYNPVVIPESGELSFSDKSFDIVYCSSVIEHVTIPKDEIWACRSGSEFKKRSLGRQEKFAQQIKRVGRSYFVQTPYKYFPIESHTWLPFVGWMPRCVVMLLLIITNRVWVKKASPDWHLLNKAEISSFFPDAGIVDEKFCGITKSIIAIKNDTGPSGNRNNQHYSCVTEFNNAEILLTSAN